MIQNKNRKHYHGHNDGILPHDQRPLFSSDNPKGESQARAAAGTDGCLS